MKKTLGEFQTFIAKGNVIDMAVGVIVGGAFGKIVTSLVNDIIMPPIGLILGGVNFNNLFISLNGKHYATLAEAQKAAAPTLNYGAFINNIINFLIVAFCVFAMVKVVMHLQKIAAQTIPKQACPPAPGETPKA